MRLILGFLGFFPLMDISIELTKVRKLLERQEADCEVVSLGLERLAISLGFHKRPTAFSSGCSTI
jgi:hypothetical protein